MVTCLEFKSVFFAFIVFIPLAFTANVIVSCKKHHKQLNMDNVINVNVQISMYLYHLNVNTI